MAIGSYVDVLTDEIVAALEAAIDDDEALLRVAFYVESTNRLDHLVRLMPPRARAPGDPARARRLARSDGGGRGR